MELNLDAGDLPATITINGETYYRKQEPDEPTFYYNNEEYVDYAAMLILRIKAIAQKTGCTEQQAAWAINTFGGGLEGYPS
jgi:hypothetical protein